MTFERWMRDRLIGGGFFEKDVNAVVKNVKAAPENEAIAQRWHDDIEGYSPQMVNVLWFTVKRHALEYIDEHCPQAWFRPLFAEVIIPLRKVRGSGRILPHVGGVGL